MTSLASRPLAGRNEARTGTRQRTSPARDEGASLEPGMSLGLVLLQHPVVAAPTAADGGEWTASFTVVLVESGGVSGTIHSVQASVVPRPSEALVRSGSRRPTASAAARPDRRRVPARGAVEIGLTLRYAFTTGAREAVAEVSVIVVGHDGYHYRVAERFPIV